jgi:hypothetical protein
MKKLKLKLSDFNEKEKLNNDELTALRGGESGGGIFGWCSCPCSCCCDNCTPDRSCNRSSLNSSTCRCTDKNASATTCEN